MEKETEKLVPLCLFVDDDDDELGMLTIKEAGDRLLSGRDYKVMVSVVDAYHELEVLPDGTLADMKGRTEHKLDLNDSFGATYVRPFKIETKVTKDFDPTGLKDAEKPFMVMTLQNRAQLWFETGESFSNYEDAASAIQEHIALDGLLLLSNIPRDKIFPELREADGTKTLTIEDKKKLLSEGQGD